MVDKVGYLVITLTAVIKVVPSIPFTKRKMTSQLTTRLRILRMVMMTAATISPQEMERKQGLLPLVSHLIPWWPPYL
jgi:hypothetical protein